MRVPIRRCFAATVAVIAVGVSTAPATAGASAGATPSVVARPLGLPPFLFRLRLVQIPSFNRYNPVARSYVEEEGETALRRVVDRFTNSGGSVCLRPLAASFCLLPPPRIATGVSLPTYNGKIAGVWTS